jgi:hypothetical protein
MQCDRNHNGDLPFGENPVTVDFRRVRQGLLSLPTLGYGLPK